MPEKVMVAMSGGVDSSAAAALLLNKGYEIFGVTLKLFSNEDIGDFSTRTCCSLSDIEDARSVAHKLGFEHFVFNFGNKFKAEVIGSFTKAYLSGKTPNPCIDCNRFIKFGPLLDRAVALNMDYIATGHYARVEYDSSAKRFLLKKAADKSKDQTYVLYALTQEQLSKTLFPLGELHKSQVREIAEKLRLANADKPDSQDICFIKNNDYASFIESNADQLPPPGNFIDCSGKVLGTHKGLFHYTVGQRRGFGISSSKPLYVIKKDIESNTVVLGEESQLYSRSFLAEDINLISVSAIDKPMEAYVKTRYSQTEAKALLTPQENGDIHVTFESPQRAITPGQAAVFYDGDKVIGGGTISY